MSCDTAIQILQKAAARQKKAYDTGLTPMRFDEGDLVWPLYTPVANEKLGLGWIGPYRVVQKVIDVTFKVEHCEYKETVVVHVDQLKKYTGQRNLVNIHSNGVDLSFHEPETFNNSCR